MLFRSYFAESSVAFIGGSLDSTGGHNMLEAAEHSKPIIFGPNVVNFAEVSQSLLDDDAAIQVRNANQLFEQIIDLLANEKRRTLFGFPFASTPGGITPNDCPGNKLPASGVPLTSIATCRTKLADFLPPFVHTSVEKIVPVTGALGFTRFIGTVRSSGIIVLVFYWFIHGGMI